MKIRLDIEYDGSRFYGWQRQDNSDLITVQKVLEEAIYKVFGEREEVNVYGAGRTDTGVHAINQVAHFEVINCSWQEGISSLAKAINFYIRETGVIVKSTSLVDENFHARFSAKMKKYLYIIYNSPYDSSLLKNRVWNIRKALDIDLMRREAQSFIGFHDFSAFRSSDCQSKNALRTINNFEITKKEDFIFIEISAKSFLHNQVRIMVGTLKEIGSSKMPQGTIEYLLKDKDRRRAGVTAPPYGLYLKEVSY